MSSKSHLISLALISWTSCAPLCPLMILCPPHRLSLVFLNLPGLSWLRALYVWFSLPLQKLLISLHTAHSFSSWSSTASPQRGLPSLPSLNTSPFVTFCLSIPFSDVCLFLFVSVLTLWLECKRSVDNRDFLAWSCIFSSRHPAWLTEMYVPTFESVNQSWTRSDVKGLTVYCWVVGNLKAVITVIYFKSYC